MSGGPEEGFFKRQYPVRDSVFSVHSVCETFLFCSNHCVQSA
jgi:hypothetical protein